MQKTHFYSNLIFLTIACAFNTTQVVQAKPLDNVDYSVRLDGTMQLRGGVEFFVFDFGSASGGMALSGPVGLKDVSMAQDLHVAGEHNTLLLKPPPQRQGGSIAIGGNITAGVVNASAG